MMDRCATFGTSWWRCWFSKLLGHRKHIGFAWKFRGTHTWLRTNRCREATPDDLRVRTKCLSKTALESCI